MWYGMLETESDYPDIKELSVFSHDRYYRGEGIMLRRHTYRMDGFVSIYAPFSGGSVTTKPMIASGTRLALNYSTSAGGELKVQVIDENGKTVITSPVIYGDKIDEKIKLNIPKEYIGKTIKLKFQLKDAEIFAFRFTK
jgi:hypothetical protein